MKKNPAPPRVARTGFGRAPAFAGSGYPQFRYSLHTQVCIADLSTLRAATIPHASFTKCPTGCRVKARRFLITLM